jgi:hypothetical protein
MSNNHLLLLQSTIVCIGLKLLCRKVRHELTLATIPSELGQIFYGKHRANILSKSLGCEMPEYPRGQVFLGKNMANILSTDTTSRILKDNNNTLLYST